ncbi:DUF393 domain-containing protein [Vibrio sinaloensis]|nr:DUF393 domain-containing protein [Vibrio sinaloensis]
MQALKKTTTTKMRSVLSIYTANPLLPILKSIQPKLQPSCMATKKDNQLILGLDVTYYAWHLVGKGWLYAPLRWPLFKPVADWAYMRFANNRYTISKWLTGKSKCSNGQCSR